MSADVVLSVRLSTELKAEWDSYCRSKGELPSHAIRTVIRHLLKQTGESCHFQAVQEDPDGTKSRIELRLSASEREAIERIAGQVGTSSNKWISDLVRAYLTHEPQLGMQELQVIGESNQQLRAIGRNLNQIAHALNRDQRERNTAWTAEQLVEVINRHTESVHAAIRSNLERWRVTWR